MPIYEATVYRIDTSQKINIGTTAKKTKSQMLKIMKSQGNEVIGLFDDCGDFEFIWNTQLKIWEFFDGCGVKVGLAKFEINSEKTLAKANAQYHEDLQAYNAYKRMK